MIFENWHPVTHDYGLINTPCEKVVECLIDFHKSINIRHDTKKFDTENNIRNIFQYLLPLSNAKQRKLFISTKTTWTAFFQNGIQGSDPYPLMSHLAEKMNVIAMRVCATQPNNKYPATIWEVYAPEALDGNPPLGYKRSIYASNDGGKWVFGQSGDPYSFEKLHFYNEKRKKERFTKELLCEYLTHFDIKAFNDSFFEISAHKPAFLLQQTYPKIKMPEFTLEEVKAGKPWKNNS